MIRSTRLACVLAAVGLSFVSIPATAQVNPFADEEPAEQESKSSKSRKKKKSQKKKDDEEAAAQKKEAEAAAEAAEAAEQRAAEEAAEAAESEAARQAAEAEAARVETEELAAAQTEQPVTEGPRRIELVENFSRAELVTTGIVLPVGLTLAIAGNAIFDEPAASMTTPNLDSIDYRLSIASHGDLREGNPLLGGTFDVAGIAFPGLLGGFYLVSGLYFWAADEPMLASQSMHIDHSMVGMAQTIGWTAFAAGLTHSLVGRQRPYAAFGRTAYGDPSDSGVNGSFLSTTSALSFAAASFAARDYAAHARKEGASFVLATVVPYTVLYGVSALIGYSSIYNQQHYFSDVAIGALVGSLIGHLSYAAHFEQDGTPRLNHAAEPTARLTPLVVPGGDDGVAYGVGLTSRW